MPAAATLAAFPATHTAPSVELADVIRRYGRAYQREYHPHCSHVKVMNAIESCRTKALGGHVDYYTQRVGISNDRLLAIVNDKVMFHYRDRANNDRKKVATVPALEFIRRFLLHVLPLGFRRVRHYGFLSAPNKKKQLTQCRRLLAQQRGVFDPSLMAIMQQPKEPDAQQENKSTAEWMLELMEVDIRHCPRCKKPGLERHPIFAEDRDDDDHPTFWDTS